MGNFDDTAHVGDHSPRRMSTAMVDGVRTMLAGAVLVTEEPTVVGKGFIAGGNMVAGVRRTRGGDAGVGELLQQRLNPRAQTRTERAAQWREAVQWREGVGQWRDMMHAAACSSWDAFPHQQQHQLDNVHWTFLQLSNVMFWQSENQMFNTIVILIMF